MASASVSRALVDARADALGRIIEADRDFLLWQKAAGGAADGVVALPGALDGVMGALRFRTHSYALKLEIVGGTRHLWAGFVPVTDKQGQVVAVSISLEDWTAERARILAAQAENARFRDFARASGEWYWEIDAELAIVAICDPFAELLGAPAPMLHGRSLLRLGRLLETDGEVPLLWARRDRTAFRNQLMLVEAPIGPRRLRLTGVPLSDGQGSFKGFRGIARLVETAAESEPPVPSRNDFLAAVSHELRTPLNAIIGFAETMSLQMMGPLQPQYVDYARDITAAGRHLLTLIEEVLDISAIESGDVGLTLEDADLVALAKQARIMVTPRATVKNLTLEIVEPDAAVVARADRRRLTQILVNILGNAVKFTPEDGLIVVRFGREGGEGRQVAVSISDSGPGIPAEDRERVFEKFRQLSGQAYSGRPEGTGLGLHISRELARLMGGEIRIDEAPEGGARFTLLLPRVA